jgi:hypothetical protein
MSDKDLIETRKALVYLQSRYDRLMEAAISVLDSGWPTWMGPSSFAAHRWLRRIVEEQGGHSSDEKEQVEKEAHGG